MAGFEPPELYVGAFLISFLATCFLTPAAAALARRHGLLDHPASNKFHSVSTPYMGGAAVAAALLTVGGVAAGASAQLGALLVGGLGLSIVGLVDDRWNLHPLVKLAFQVAGGAGMWLADLRAVLFGVDGLDLALTVLWVVGVTNAVNMLDNMDGLIAGTSVVGAATFFLIAAQQQQVPAAAFSLAIAGSSLGFLPYNLPPARVFLGDAGSLFLGFLLAGLGLELGLLGGGGLVLSAIPLLVLGVPLLDATLAVAGRCMDGRPIYIGGLDHSSHRLVALGLTVRQVMLLTYGVQIMLAAIAFWLLGASVESSVAVLSVIALAALTALALLLRVPPLSPRETAEAASGTSGSSSRQALMRTRR
jgi:UDP-GlcNAc:undecaprenyl-phosphate GlcNAc-1-phosphate transferase